MKTLCLRSDKPAQGVTLEQSSEQRGRGLRGGLRWRSSRRGSQTVGAIQEGRHCFITGL